MAGQEALIRVKLDTSGARSDLEALYRDFRRAPGVLAPGVGGGGAGAAGGGVGAGGGAGGFNVGALLGTLMKWAPVAGVAAPIARDLFGPARSMLGGLGEALNPLAGISGADQGRQQTRDQVANMLGAARGFGLIGRAESDALYDQLARVNVPIAEGKATIRSELGWVAAKDTFSDAVNRFSEVVNNLVGKKEPSL